MSFARARLLVSEPSPLPSAPLRRPLPPGGNYHCRRLPEERLGAEHRAGLCNRVATRALIATASHDNDDHARARARARDYARMIGNERRTGDRYASPFIVYSERRGTTLPLCCDSAEREEGRGGMEGEERSGRLVMKKTVTEDGVAHVKKRPPRAPLNGS